MDKQRLPMTEFCVSQTLRFFLVLHLITTAFHAEGFGSRGYRNINPVSRPPEQIQFLTRRMNEEQSSPVYGALFMVGIAINFI
jgi:hypothetical protein